MTTATRFLISAILIFPTIVHPDGSKCVPDAVAFLAEATSPIARIDQLRTTRQELVDCLVLEDGADEPDKSTIFKSSVVPDWSASDSSSWLDVYQPKRVRTGKPAWICEFDQDCADDTRGVKISRGMAQFSKIRDTFLELGITLPQDEDLIFTTEDTLKRYNWESIQLVDPSIQYFPWMSTD